MGKKRGKVKKEEANGDPEDPPWLRPGWGPAFPKDLGCDACPRRVHPNDANGLANHRQKCGNEMRSDAGAGKADFMMCIGCGKQWHREKIHQIIKHEGVCARFKALGVGTASSRSTTRPKIPRGPRRVTRARARTLGVQLAPPLNFDFLNRPFLRQEARALVKRPKGQKKKIKKIYSNNLNNNGTINPPRPTNTYTQYLLQESPSF